MEGSIAYNLPEIEKQMKPASVNQSEPGAPESNWMRLTWM